MDVHIVAVDLAKDVFEAAWATAGGRVDGHRRLTRSQFERFLRAQQAGTEIVMEACSSSHHWGRVRSRIAAIQQELKDGLARVNALRRARAHADRLTALQRWVVELAGRRGYNKAVSALANKLARIIWAVWRHDVDFSARTPAAG
jgi:transposase